MGAPRNEYADDFLTDCHRKRYVHISDIEMNGGVEAVMEFLWDLKSVVGFFSTFWVWILLSSLAHHSCRQHQIETTKARHLESEAFEQEQFRIRHRNWKMVT
jgi:hypothetical protein